MNVEVKVKVVEEKKDENRYSSRDYDIEWFEVVVKGNSTAEVEKKIAKLQEAALHLGLKLE